ncbi:hypothetical protein MNBD_GAMMA16-662 [hydrothermal vent metagenome]|uniref:DUF5060 domain-containing protein n=1 Tax=hydrothermal vent metagenome TaxID=652676 RepID=A0A3B0ZJ58_9ZZZZ
MFENENLYHRTLYKVILLLVCMLFSHGIYANSSIALYDVFEISASSENEYKNSFDYQEVELVGEFESPHGDIYQVSGFYDGVVNKKNIWRLRFMPSMAGEWKYKVFSLDGKEDTVGHFMVSSTPAQKTNHGHIKVDPEHPQYLIYDDGTPHYWVGGKWFSAKDYGPPKKEGEVNDSVEPNSNVRFAWKSDKQITDYLDLLVKYKHNGVLIKTGLYPLEKDGLSWDLEWIKRGEWLIKEALDRGIYVQINMFDTWSRDKKYWFKNNMDGSGQPFNVWKDEDDHKKRNYIRTLVSRFAAFPNVYWELGNEMEHKPNCGPCFVELSNKKYIPWIKEADPYSLPIGLSEEIWRDADVDIAFLHQTNVLDHLTWTKPVVMNELVRFDPPPSLLNDLYKNLHWRIKGAYKKLFGKPGHRGLWHNDAMNDSELRFAYRRTFWSVFVLGGAGASEATWLQIDEPYSEALHHVMSDHMHLASVVEQHTLTLNKMKPITEAVISGSAKTITRGIEGQVYITYFDAGYDADVRAANVRIKIPEGHYTGAWYNTKSGDVEKFDAMIGSEGASFQHPDFKEDIVLIMINKVSH